jgi:ketosteroid isomerase-like protein
MPTKDELSAAAMQAALDVIAAFGSHDVERYFGGFAPEATFLFHAEPAILPSRAAYEAAWAEWERDGFRVLSCTSLHPRLDLVTDEVAVFTHSVRTRLAGVDEEQRERETIVLRRGADGRWLGVHEHLSLDSPQDVDPLLDEDGADRVDLGSQ